MMFSNDNFVIFNISVKDAYDYQGRSYLHIPQDIGINLKTDEPPERCFLPKRHIHTWQVNIIFAIERNLDHYGNI